MWRRTYGRTDEIWKASSRPSPLGSGKNYVGPLLMGAKRHLNSTSQEGTDTQTNGHRDSMTESAQWADSVKRDELSIFVELPWEGFVFDGLPRMFFSYS